MFDSEVYIVEDCVLMFNDIFDGDSVDLLLDVGHLYNFLNHEWHLLAHSVLFNFVDGELPLDGHFVWHLDLGGVVLPEFCDIWLIDGDFEQNLVPLSLGELLLNMIWFFFILGHGHLLGYDVWNFLDNSVVNSLGDFVRNVEFFFIWYLVIDCVWYLLCNNVWNLVDD